MRKEKWRVGKRGKRERRVREILGETREVNTAGMRIREERKMKVGGEEGEGTDEGEGRRKKENDGKKDIGE